MIQNKDCLDYLSSLDDSSVDLVVTDPPYFIGFDGGKGWDSQWNSELDYLSWCKQWTDECVRVLKPNRMLIVWGTLKTETFLKYKLETSATHNDTLTPQNEIIWGYNWGGRSKSNFARKHEYAWCWSKGEDFLFNDKEIRVERKLKKNIRTGKDYTEGTIPTCIWEKNNHTTSKDYCGWHPTTKNLDVMERIIRAYTLEGDTVLDIFMGSGSTAIAAKRAGRKYIGCEKDSEYYQKLSQRLASETNILDFTA
tara:strand:- start:67 stop:822 length:756 start_codon:yes stop_codon:yes gene_type:complete